MSGLTSVLKRIAAAALAATLVTACRQSDHPVTELEPVTLEGTPSALYDRSLTALRQRVSEGTQVVRVDEPGSITIRLTVRASTGSLRLVELVLRQIGPEATSVAATSQRFSFLPGSSRDELDPAIETEIIELLGPSKSSKK